MNGLAPSASWKTVVLVTIALTGLLFSWAVERRSPERANRLYREGALDEAAMIYADQLGRDSASAKLHYNYGTALLGLRNARASEELARVDTEADEEIQVRALYNLGVWHLAQALNAEGIDSARAHASSAVAANKRALRLQPGRADVSWNLAIALRVLAPADAERHQRGPTKAATRDGALAETDGAGNANDAEDAHDGPQNAEAETAARAGEVAPLSRSEASQVLGTGHRDPTMMVNKLMAFEGRSLRSRAPRND